MLRILFTMFNNKVKTMATKPNPTAFYSDGLLHEEVASRMGLSKSALSCGITQGLYPFKRCRIKIGRYYVYNWSKCVDALQARLGS